MKIFVGGLPRDITHEEFRSFFERFGNITDIVIIHHKQTNRSRGFGFVSFDSEEVVENILQNQFYELKNQRVEVKRATPREDMNNVNNYSNLDNVEPPNYNFVNFGHGDLANPYNCITYFQPLGFTNNQYYHVCLGNNYYGPWFNHNPTRVYPYDFGFPVYNYYFPHDQFNGGRWG